MGVATAIAVGSLALSAGTTAMSFIEAGEQKKKQRQAEAAAAQAMKTAREKLEINFTDKMAVQKEPYELQREAMLSQGAQAIQAGVESERGAAATAGKVMMAQNEAQAGIRTEMGKEMTDIQNKQIQEESRLRDLGVQLDLGEVEGQQRIAMNAEESAAANKAQGIQGAISTAQQGLNMMPLYFKDSANKTTAAVSGVPKNPYQAPAMSSFNTQNTVAPASVPLFDANQITPSYAPGVYNWSGVGF